MAYLGKYLERLHPTCSLRTQRHFETLIDFRSHLLSLNLKPALQKSALEQVRENNSIIAEASFWTKFEQPGIRWADHEDVEATPGWNSGCLRCRMDKLTSCCMDEEGAQKDRM